MKILYSLFIYYLNIVATFQALAVRRHQCETMDADPLVWTNHRFIRWARSIDLGEYADNLKGNQLWRCLDEQYYSLNEYDLKSIHSEHS